MDRHAKAPAVLVLAVALVVALAGQAMADRVAIAGSGPQTGRAVGRATLSYLSGLRTFAGAVLWIRMDPLLHTYYRGVPLAEQRYLLSSIAMVEWLDPSLEEPYYVGSWILAKNERESDGLAMARRGVGENPESGLLIVNLAQMTMLFGDGVTPAVEIGAKALEPGITWRDDTEKGNALAALGGIFRAGGRNDLDARVQEEIARTDTGSAGEAATDEHDHDRDGAPDH